MRCIYKCLILSAVAVLASSWGQASAQTAYDLRGLSVSNGMAFGTAPAESDQKYLDPFTNGDPLVGPAYKNSVTGTGSYGVFGTPSPGVELSGPASDIFGDTYGLGRMRFQRADAKPSPTNLDAPGTVTMRESLRLENLPTPLLTKTQNWEVETYWNYVLPDSSSAYGIRISDNPLNAATSGVPFNDLIDLRLVRNVAGAPVVSLRRLVWDGSALAVQDATFYSLAAALFPGKTLADIAGIAFRLHYNTATGGDPGGLIAGLDLTGADDTEVGYINYAPILPIFNGETTTHVGATALWTAAVPEPATWVLALFGIAALAWRGRRVG